MSYPAEGTLAPDFTLDTDAGTPLTLSSLRGRPVVLFFYPKDDTPGCTIESCEFRDLMPRFQGVNAAVLGISPDDVKSHVKSISRTRCSPTSGTRSPTRTASGRRSR